MPTSVPKVFLSYSHDSDIHKAWVVTLSQRLTANGVDVILDRWNLTLGSDLPRFMESGLSEADRVIAVCSSNYVAKANSGLGGVGYEKMILSAQLMANLNQDRVIPLLRGNSEGILPYFLGARLYVDFSDDSSYESKYQDLIREIHGAKVLPRPPIGPNPFAARTLAPLSFSQERYVSPVISGTVTFDYSNNDGRFMVGSGDLSFETQWSRAGSTSIYAYRDGTNIQCVSLAFGVTSLSHLGEVSHFDNSSRVRNPSLGEIVIWKNRNGYYLATQVNTLSIRHLDRSRDEIIFSYVIQPNRTSDFSGSVAVQGAT